MGQFMEKLQDAPINDIADALVNKISPPLSDINNNLDKNNQQVTQQTQQLQQANQQLQQANEYNSYNTYNNSTTNNSSTNNYYNQNNMQKEQQNNQQNKQIDYTSMLENIEDLLEQIKKKLNAQPQMSF
jgi:DNA repair exonuclease SbcCD ATPase subunit